jgi:hypothetical protein
MTTTSSTDTTTGADVANEILGLLAVLGVLAAMVVVLVLVLRHRREMGVIAARAAMGPGHVPSAIRMTPDGSHWWNGHTWVRSDLAPPPSALLSPDGRAWYDGLTWHALQRSP